MSVHISITNLLNSKDPLLMYTWGKVITKLTSLKKFNSTFLRGAKVGSQEGKLFLKSVLLP